MRRHHPAVQRSGCSVKFLSTSALGAWMRRPPSPILPSCTGDRPRVSVSWAIWALDSGESGPCPDREGRRAPLGRRTQRADRPCHACTTRPADRARRSSKSPARTNRTADKIRLTAVADPDDRDRTVAGRCAATMTRRSAGYEWPLLPRVHAGIPRLLLRRQCALRSGRGPITLRERTH